MSRRCWIAALGAFALVSAVVALSERETVQPAPPEPTVGAGSPSPSSDPAAPSPTRPRQATSRREARAPVEGAAGDLPAWSASPLELQAPTPDQLPCGELDCLTEDPDRYRTEIHGTLAREGLERLLADLSIGGEEADEIRSQLEANLESFASGP